MSESKMPEWICKMCKHYPPSLHGDKPCNFCDPNSQYNKEALSNMTVVMAESKRPAGNAIGLAFKAAREHAGLSRMSLSQKANLSPAYIGQVERGEFVPTIKACIQVADVLQISVDELCGRYDATRISAMERANRELGVNLRMALEDMKLLDACEICTWWNDGCTAPKDVKMSGSCFVWRRCAK